MRASRFLRWHAELIVAHPARVLVVAAAIAVICALIVPGLDIEGGHSGLVDDNDVHQRRFERFLARYGSPNLLFVLVEGGDAHLRRRVIDALERRLPSPQGSKGGAESCRGKVKNNQSGCVRDVVGRVDSEALHAYAPLFLPLSRLKRLVDAIVAQRQAIARLVKARDLGQLLSTAAAVLEDNAERASAEVSSADQARTVMSGFAAIIDHITDRVRGVADDGALPELLQRLAGQRDGNDEFAGVDGAGYFSSKDGKLHIAVVRPVDDSDDPKVIVPFVHHVQAAADALVREFSKACQAKRCDNGGKLRAVLTGMPALVAAEKEALGRDLPLTTTVAICGILALFVFGFRSLLQGLVGLFPLVVSLLATLAFVRLAIGNLNLLTSAFVPTVLGLGIDFSVHLLSRYNEARRAGEVSARAIRIAITRAGPGMVTGAFTTAGAFCALAVSDFRGFAQLGLITAVGLVLSLIATLTISSAMLVLPRFRSLQRPPPEPYLGNAPLVARLVARHRWTVLIGTLMLTAAMVWRGSSIPWSYNYLDLLPKGSQAVEAMKMLSQRTTFSGEVAGLEADNLEQAERYVRELRNKTTVGHVESVVGYIPRQQQAKIALLSQLRVVVANLDGTGARRAPTVSVMREGLQTLTDTLQDLRFAARSAGRQEASLFAPPLEAAQRLDVALDDLPVDKALVGLKQAQRDILGAIDRGRELLMAATRVAPLDAQRLVQVLPAPLRARLVQNGHYAIYVYPSQSLWAEGFLQRFVEDLREVNAAATGFPVTYWETNVAIEKGFRRASLLAVVALVLLLLVDFRSLRFALFAVLPLALGIALMWGGMSVLHLSYNFANIIAFPLIIGIGVASGVHVLHRYRQQGERDIESVIRNTGLAIFLSATTTMVGFGSLSLASHRGASSLGEVLLIGVGACLATSTLFLPALLDILERQRGRSRCVVPSKAEKEER